MSENWLEGTGTLNYTERYRSWRQNIETPLGGDIILTAWIERVRIFDDGSVLKDNMGPITIPMSSLINSPQLPEALAIRSCLTSIIGLKVNELFGPPIIEEDHDGELSIEVNVNIGNDAPILGNE